jgi:hypothetical protein
MMRAMASPLCVTKPADWPKLSAAEGNRIRGVGDGWYHGKQGFETGKSKR